MGAVDYAGIRDRISSVLASDARLKDVRIFVEEDPQFGISDLQQCIVMYMDGRSGSNQVLSANTRLRYELRVQLAVLAFSMESYKQACDLRDNLLGVLELALITDCRFGDFPCIESSWLVGGEMYSAKNAQSSTWVAAAETQLVLNVIAVNG